MVIPDFKHLCLLAAFLFVSSTVHAQIYKWVDEHGQTHYTQQPPATGEAEQITVPPPPPIDQQQVEQEADVSTEPEQSEPEQAEQSPEELAEQEAARQENCRIARHNQKMYQDNPGRRYIDVEGNAYRLTDEEYQQKLEETQQLIDLYCE